jgi:hypothetical protein
MTLTAEPARRGFLIPRLVEPAELPKTDEPPAERVEITVAKAPPSAAIPAPAAAPPQRPEVEPAIRKPELRSQRAAPPEPQPGNLPAAGSDAAQPQQKARRKRNRGRRRKRKPDGS